MRRQDLDDRGIQVGQVEALNRRRGRFFRSSSCVAGSTKLKEPLDMTVSAKCYYALRAIYALAEYRGTAPMKANEIAERQHIPIKFLEAILSQLKGGGFVNSRRGAEGGYLLAHPPQDLTVGAIIRFIDGPVAPVDCVSQSRPKQCEYPGHCPFFGFWGRVRQAISDVVDQTTFADMVKENQDLGYTYIADWTI